MGEAKRRRDRLPTVEPFDPAEVLRVCAELERAEREARERRERLVEALDHEGWHYLTNLQQAVHGICHRCWERLIHDQSLEKGDFWDQCQVWDDCLRETDHWETDHAITYYDYEDLSRYDLSQTPHVIIC